MNSNINGKKTKFKNPLHQNYSHIQSLKTCLADENLSLHLDCCFLQ